MSTPQLELQLWNNRTRKYEAAPPNAERAAYKAWRLCKPGRPLKPVYRPPSSTASGRTVDDVQRDYLMWARSKGLPRITAFEQKPPFNNYANAKAYRRTPQIRGPIYLGTIHYVDANAYFAVEESQGE